MSTINLGIESWKHDRQLHVSREGIVGMNPCTQILLNTYIGNAENMTFHSYFMHDSIPNFLVWEM